MKKILTVAIMAAMFLGSAVTVLAAPWKPAGENAVNDKYVAYYESGDHGIPGIGNQYLGWDMVMRRGNDEKQFHQWFEGYINGEYVGVHSVWNLSKDGECADGWVKVTDAYPNWGYYMEPGATYCVHNNYYNPTKP